MRRAGDFALTLARSFLEPDYRSVDLRPTVEVGLSGTRTICLIAGSGRPRRRLLAKVDARLTFVAVVEARSTGYSLIMGACDVNGNVCRSVAPGLHLAEFYGEHRLPKLASVYGFASPGVARVTYRYHDGVQGEVSDPQAGIVIARDDDVGVDWVRSYTKLGQLGLFRPVQEAPPSVAFRKGRHGDA